MQHESETIKENYQVLIAEYHHSLCIIEDYFKQANRKFVPELIDDTTCKLQTAHATIADAAGSLASLGCRLHPHQFQFLLKHSICPLIQLQIPAHLCHPGELRFEK